MVFRAHFDKFRLKPEENKTDSQTQMEVTCSEERPFPSQTALQNGNSPQVFGLYPILEGSTKMMKNSTQQQTESGCFSEWVLHVEKYEPFEGSTDNRFSFAKVDVDPGKPSRHKKPNATSSAFGAGIVATEGAPTLSRQVPIPIPRAGNRWLIWLWVKIQIVPPVNIPIPTKID